MAARNFSSARFGTVDESTATGVFLGEITYDYQSDKVDIKNHISSTVGFTLSDPRTDIKLSGVVTTKTAGFYSSHRIGSDACKQFSRYDGT